MTKLDELKALMAKATPGEWYRCCNYIRSTDDHLMIVAASNNNSWANETENLDLIAASQRILPALIAAVEAAQAVADDAERSLFGDETDDPACCDPYLVGRQKMRALRAALAKLGE